VHVPHRRKHTTLTIITVGICKGCSTVATKLRLLRQTSIRALPSKVRNILVLPNSQTLLRCARRSTVAISFTVVPSSPRVRRRRRRRRHRHRHRHYHARARTRTRIRARTRARADLTLPHYTKPPFFFFFFTKAAGFFFFFFKTKGRRG
jgi:hypothetical protein